LNETEQNFRKLFAMLIRSGRRIVRISRQDPKEAEKLFKEWEVHIKKFTAILESLPRKTHGIVLSLASQRRQKMVEERRKKGADDDDCE